MTTDAEDELDHHYKRTLRALQIELVKLQRHLIEKGARVLVILEGRDGAGKDGAIKRLIAHMSPRETRVHAPGVPDSREASEWYFQRFVPFLPAGGEFVVFNRSWYNRAGVEPIMGYCTKAQHEAFLETVVPFEAMLVRDGMALRKYYLDISRAEQKRRLKNRRTDPLKQWKSSPVDQAALKHWNDYSKARDKMFRRTSHRGGPWRVIAGDEKKHARLELIRDLLASFDYPGKKSELSARCSRIVYGKDVARAVK
jgi:polyphosphate kinase 2